MTDTIILPTEKHFTNDKNGKRIYTFVPYVFEWKNKEEYLAWRGIWKHTYKMLSKESREAKNARNNGFRNKEADAWKHVYKVAKLKEDANRLLEIRKEGKALSYTMKTAALKVNNG